MIRSLSIVAVIISCILLSITTASEPKNGKSLAEAVKEFNQRAEKDQIGKEQPPLTEDEVVAAIRCWSRDQLPVSDEYYDAYQEIADTGKLPEGAMLDYKSGLHNYKNLHFDVWWIDLIIMKDSGGYSYRLRDRKIRCRPIRATDDRLETPGTQDSEPSPNSPGA